MNNAIGSLLASNAAFTVPTEPIMGNVFENASMTSVFTLIVNILITIGFGLVLVFLTLGFISFITSQGDKVKTEQAQKWVTFAVIGGIGLFAVFAIKSIILNLVGAKGSDPLPGI